MIPRTNRERYIVKKNEYDMMLEIARNIEGIGTICAIRAISGRGRKRPCEYNRTGAEDLSRLERDCPNCIQKWLNEESEG